MNEASPATPGVSGTPGRESVLTVALRFTAYTLGFLALALSLPGIISHVGVGIFKEGASVESVQIAMLLACTPLLLVGGWRASSWRECLWLSAIFAGLAAIREMDSTFDRLIPLLGWKLPGALAMLGGGVFVWRSRASLRKAIPAFAAHRSFALLWTGFVIAVPFAQLLGHGAFLEELMGGDYHRGYKRVIEELGETAGYLFIFLGSAEALLASRAKAEAPQAE